jgi:4-amino-4-deoxy-L-arabinose transferase-like glycosyltransferase
LESNGSRTFLGAWAAAILVVAAIALAFQGSRGIWEPDEGFYSNAALRMAHDSDFLVPKVNDEVFLDKPPLQYWGMAAGTRLLGENEWGLRLANVLWFTLAAVSAGAISGRMWGRSHRAFGTLAYGVMLAPFVASNVLTPDTPLAFFVAFLIYAYWRSVCGSSVQRTLAWEVVAGFATGLAALTKGPAALVFAVPVLLHAVIVRGRRVALRVALLVLSIAGLLAALWYVPVMLGIPGAAAYLWDNQVWGRLVTDHYERNADWTGALAVYLPMMIVGTMPWTLRFWRFAAEMARRTRALEPWTSSEILLALLVAAPLAVFTIARSRLPLYVLPVLPAVAVIAARETRGAYFATGLPGFSIRGLVACWVVALIGLKAVAAFVPVPQAEPLDSRRLAQELRAAGVRPDAEIVNINTKQNGLVAYGYRQLTWCLDGDAPYPFFTPLDSLGAALREVGERHPSQVALIVDPTSQDGVLDRLPATLRGCVPTKSGDFVVLNCSDVETVAAGTARHRVDDSGLVSITSPAEPTSQRVSRFCGKDPG